MFKKLKWIWIFFIPMHFAWATSNPAMVPIISYLLSDSNKVQITGTISYDYVPSNENHVGLNYNTMTQKTCKNVYVEALDASDEVLATTKTNNNGYYTFSLDKNIDIRIRVSAKMYQTGLPAWDVKVVDNTNSDALYVMQGNLVSTGTSDSIRNLNAPSGWGGSSYTSTRVAAPFAILDTINSAIQKVLSADAQLIYPSLQVNWSVNNVAATGDKSQGQIGTSHYFNSNLFILGDEDSDTDEYDDHVIAHEWGHYYEDKFSRSDNIGGNHGGGEILDIRVAFGEGWGNAFSAIALENPFYFDTVGSQQSDGGFIDIESGTSSNDGWFSERSIQRIIYDLYDSNEDNNDILALGFTPIHEIFIGAEKSTSAFTSIFTFIHALKAQNNTIADDIDTVVADESIASISNIYGTEQTNRASELPYHDLTVGTTLHDICTSQTHGSYNKLGNKQFITFTIASERSYTLKVEQTNASDADPDFKIYKVDPFEYKGVQNTTGSIESSSETLTTGSYLLDIYDYNEINSACFDVSVN